MAKPISFLSVVCFIAVVVLASSSLAVSPLSAQETLPPQLLITKIDIEDFPNVGVFVYGQNLGADLGSVPMTLTEDGRVQQVTASELVDVGTQTVLLLDASTDIRKPGVTGRPRFEEVSDAVIHLTDVRKILSPVDWLAAYVPSTRQQIVAIKDWTNDHNEVRNNLYRYLPEEEIGETPLFELIYFGLDAFNNNQLDSRAQRSMILFSDGIDNVSGLQIDDAIARANVLGVRIHTVLLGEGTREARANLERIAIMTGGQNVGLTAVEALDPIWNSIAQGRQQRLLSYRTRTVQPKEVAVRAELAQGAVVAQSPFPPVPRPEPVNVVIVQPAPEQEIVRQSDSYSATVESLTPTTLPIQVAFDWPDANPRSLQRVEYTLGSDTRVVDAEPFDRIDFPIATLGNGVYALRVQAVDELGITGSSRPVSVRVRVDVPPAPTPTPIPGLETKGPLNPTNMRWLTLASLVLALVALFFAIFVLLRKPAVRDTVTQAFSNTVKAVTQPFTLDRRMKGHQAVKAKLVLVEGDPSLPQSVEIVGSNTRIGRDSTLSNVVLDDPRVSRYHCRISEEGDGSFRIFDEGSTSGTYVNYKPVDIRGQVLKHGDQVHIGPIGMRFEVSKPGEAVSEPVFATEPYVPQFDALADDDPFKTEQFKLQTPERKDGQ